MDAAGLFALALVSESEEAAEVQLVANQPLYKCSQLFKFLLVYIRGTIGP